MSFLGIVGSRNGAGLSAPWREPSFSLFVTIGLESFCRLPMRGWQGNDNAAIRDGRLRLVPAAD
jgi:hypothetical protein